MDVKFVGKEINLAGKQYILPPLGMNAYKKNDAFKKIQYIKDTLTGIDENTVSEIPVEVLDTMIKLIHLALLRNYPDISIEFLEDALSFDDCNSFIPLLVSQNQKVQEQMVEHVKNVQER